MSSATVLLRISHALSLVGGSVAVFGGWLLGQPSDGANIGAGLILFVSAALVAMAIITWIAGLVARSAAGPSRRERMGAAPESA